jgi:N-methylhydantoinase B
MIDPITFEVLRHRLATIVDEGAAVMRNVSGSPSVAQSNDCNVALLTTEGEGVVIGRTIASHAMSCIQTTKYVLKEYRENPGIGPGDMFFTNHPYIGTPHQTCGVMVGPIVVGDRIVAWSGAGIHFGDVGGTVPGQVSIGARSIWDEPMPLPPVRIVERGVLRKDIEDDFLTRSRTRIQNGVDLKAMVGANNAMARRIQALAQRYGADIVVEALHRVIATSEQKLRSILREIPDGRWQCENFIDYYDDNRLKMYACRLTLTKQGEELAFDFTKSSGQAPAVVNATYAATEGYLLRAMLGIFGFAVTHCPAAIQRIVRIEATPGTIVNCSWPAGVCKGTTSVTQSVWQVATHCLSQMLLESPAYARRAIAVSRGNLMILDLMGTDQYGGAFAAVLQECCLAAGSGAGASGDGIDTGGVTEPEVSIPNVENNEFRYPILYLYRRQRRDSGGPGEFRGGVGVSMAFTPHDADGIGNVMIHSHGVGSPSALGLAGGYPAETNRLSILRKTNLDDLFRRGVIPAEVSELKQDAIETPPSFTYTKLGRGDVFECMGGGGGGFGDPLNRAPESVLMDVQNRLVSPEQARGRYGVAFRKDDATLDQDAIAAERARIRASRKANSHPVEARPDGSAMSAVRCRCGKRADMASDANRFVAVRDNPCKVDAFTLDHTVHESQYVVREVLCPACWAVLDTQVRIPQVEP